ncbi:MAG: hypothetical protein ACOYBD_05080 [Bilifractor sp.]
MTEKERYQRAFSMLHTSDSFQVDLNGTETPSARHARHFRAAVSAACAVLVLTIGGTSVYAADVGGIQRKVQIWMNGDLTDAVLSVDDGSGTYSIKDASGNLVSGGGGIAMDADGSERALTSSEISDHLENQVTTDTIDGRLYLFYKDQKIDITDQFGEDEYCYLTLKNGKETLYVTAKKDGGVAYSKNRYLIPGKDFDV